MAWMGTCIGFLVAVALIGVGASVIRSARPGSGYLFIAAGVFELLMRCCVFGLTPTRLLETVDMDPDLIQPLIITTRVLGMLEALIVAVLLAVAFVGLARDLKAAAPSA